MTVEAAGVAEAVDPRRRWDELAGEVERLNQTDPRAGLAIAERWLGEEMHDGGRARALRAVADALRFSGQYERADSCFAEAERIFVELGLADEAARSKIGHVSVLRYLGRYDEAVRLGQENLAYLESRGGDLEVEAVKQTINLGSVYWRLGDLPSALTCYRRARRAARRLGEGEWDAAASINVGLVLADLGRYSEALKANEYAARRCRALGLRERLATALMNLGQLHAQRGEYAQALEMLDSSRAICDELGLDRKRAAVDLDLVRTYLALNLDAEAAEACARAVDTLRRCDLPHELSQALIRSSQIAERRGELDLAHAYAAEAGDLFAKIGDAISQHVAQIQALRVAGQRVDEALMAGLISAGRGAATRLEKLGALDHAAMAWLVVGDLEARIGRRAEALESYERAADVGRQLGADAVLHVTHTARGELIEADAPEEALASFGQAVEHLERLRERARADDLKMAIRHGTNLYERIAGLLLRKDEGERARDAFHWIERGKSRGLLEELLARSEQGTHRRSPKVIRVRERIMDLRVRLNEAYTERYASDRPVVGRGGAPATDGVERMEAELARATRQLQILLRADRASDVTSLLDVERVQAAIPEDTCLIEYMVVDQEILCFVLRRDSFRVQRGLGTVHQVEEAAQWFWFHIRKGTYGAEYLRANQRTLAPALERALRRLDELLLAPLAELREVDHLVIVPHGLLHTLPFHAFTHRGAALLDRVTVSYAPSAAVYAAAVERGERRPRQPLVVAPTLPDLPWVGEEAARLADLFPSAVVLTGRRATLRALRRYAPHCDALHLATHGVFRADNPTFSALELADGWLSVGELAELSGERALIALSACHTGMSGIGPGDELLGLTRAVLGAGSTALLASLWAANDDTTPAMMAAFYEGLLRGKSRAASIRDAALAIRADEPHPYFWAPFILVGAP